MAKDFLAASTTLLLTSHKSSTEKKNTADPLQPQDVPRDRQSGLDWVAGHNYEPTRHTKFPSLPRCRVPRRVNSQYINIYNISFNPDGNDVFNFRCSRGEDAGVSRCHYKAAASSPLLCQSYDSLERLCCACVCLAEIPLALLELWLRD